MTGGTQRQALDEYLELPGDVEDARSSSELDFGGEQRGDLPRLEQSIPRKDPFDPFSLEEERGHISPASAFSLDDLEDLEDMPPEPAEARSDEIPHESVPAGANPSTGEEDIAAPAGGWTRRKLITLIGAPCAVLAAVLFVFLLWPETGKAPVEVRKMVRSSIPFSHYQQELEFFVLSSAGDEKSIISLGVLIDFIDVSTADGSRIDDILLRDVIYSFLKSRQPRKATMAFWQKTVETELPLQLKAIMPERKIGALRIKHLERL
jgi:hypothetical protein